MNVLGTEADKYNSHDPDRYSCCYRAALMTGRRYRYFELARELNEAISFFEEKLCKTDLPLKHQHWAMFSVLDAYLCLWQCYKALKDTKKLQQLAETISAMYISTQPFSAPHVNSLVLISKCAEKLCPGTDWAGKAKIDAQAALKIRYGIEDDAQGWQGLETVTKHMKVMYALPDYVADDSSYCSSDHS
ncbi:hypothetical protein WJX79_009317 [Trebouxia sp. C0005]